MEKIGCHIGVKDLDNWGNLDTVQVFLSNPRRYQNPDVSLLAGTDKTVVVHCPYWTQMARESYENVYRATLSYIIRLAKVMHKVGQKYIVIHVGARLSGDTVSRGMDCIRDMCERWLFATAETDVVLCLENDSGSKKGTKMGSVKLLEVLLNDINSPRVRMAFDTEHAYANGFNLKDRERLERIAPLVSVVHFNSIPVYVDSGSHVDRHTETLLEESKGGLDYLKTVLDVLYDGVRPFIMEVDCGLVSKNLKALEKFRWGRV